MKVEASFQVSDKRLREILGPKRAGEMRKLKLEVREMRKEQDDARHLLSMARAWKDMCRTLQHDHRVMLDRVNDLQGRYDQARSEVKNLEALYESA